VPGPRPTAADVAALAGVSRSTVSYILNGSGMQTFHPATVEKVRSAAQQLAYAPQAAARALRRGASDVVVLPLPDLPASANFSKLLAALTDGVRETGRSLAMLALRPGDRLIEILGGVSAAAVLEVLPLPEDDRAAAATAGVPVLSVAAAIQELDRQAGARQVEHLVALGHSRLAVVTAVEPATFVFARPRLAGARDAAADAQIAEPVVEALSGPLDQALPRLTARLREWSAADQPVTAVCCFNDLFAATVASAAAKAGVRVPADLAVVGIDDEPLGGMLSPTLTTVRFDYSAVGESIRDALRHQLDDGPDPDHTPGTIEVVLRESSGPR
jgi:DNA-binding LacI/PurR family transcriptional regulator